MKVKTAGLALLAVMLVNGSAVRGQVGAPQGASGTAKRGNGANASGVSASAPAVRVVDLVAADGTKLKGTFFAAVQKRRAAAGAGASARRAMSAGPGVLLLHQCNRQRKVWDELGAQLAAAGIRVMTVDLRNYGESEGVASDKLTPEQAADAQKKWPEDVDAAYAYLVGQKNVSRKLIGVGGGSCGVDNAVQAAMRHPEVRSLVLLSGGTTFKGREFLRGASKLPVLFAMADDDEFKPSIFAIEWLYTLAGDSQKELEHYEKGGHAADIFAVHPELEKKIVDWYVQTLTRTPGRAVMLAEMAKVPEQVKVVEMIDMPDGPAKVEKLLQEARAKDAKAQLFPEDIVNFAGYEHMQAGDAKSGIEILKLNAEAYPNSPNVYDSLADLYLADGQKELALENAKKAVALIASDTADAADRKKGIQENAEQKIKQLADGPR